MAFLGIPVVYNALPNKFSVVHRTSSMFIKPYQINNVYTIIFEINKFREFMTKNNQVKVPTIYTL